MNIDKLKVLDIVEEKEFNYIVKDIDDEIFNIINNKTYRENNNIKLDDLCYIKLLHYNYDNKVQVGELIVNKKIKEDIINIFRKLFENKYQIYSMILIDNFWDRDPYYTDLNSCKHNNSSAFFYREIAINHKLSNHALGLAIDINTLENPYVIFDENNNMITDQFNDTEIYYAQNRDKNIKHVITNDDFLYKTFIEYGFEWGGDWSTPKDYQHFEKVL